MANETARSGPLMSPTGTDTAAGSGSTASRVPRIQYGGHDRFELELEVRVSFVFPMYYPEQRS